MNSFSRKKRIIWNLFLKHPLEYTKLFTNLYYALILSWNLANQVLMSVSHETVNGISKFICPLHTNAQTMIIIIAGAGDVAFLVLPLTLLFFPLCVSTSRNEQVQNVCFILLSPTVVLLILNVIVDVCYPHCYFIS